MGEYSPDAEVYPAGNERYSVHQLLHSATEEGLMFRGMPRVSDFHIKVGEPVSYRLDDDLVRVPEGEPVTQELAEKLVLPLLSEERRRQLAEDPLGDIDVGYTTPDGAYNFRINVFRDRDGLAATIRLLPPRVPGIEDIGFPYGKTWPELVQSSRGLVLVTGITGSGKSTTIASLLQHINHHRPVRIMTLEDPIEYVFKSERAVISQREVGTHCASFASGMRSVLRENPDIIYVGEIRDPETVALALTAAETGHLVFSTLHTRDAIGALTRMLDMFPAARARELTTQLSFSLKCVVSQKLVPLKEVEGRAVAMEVLRNSDGVANLIRSGKWEQIYSIMETRAREGMCTIEQQLVWLYQQGRISREQALAHANDASIVNRLDEQ